MANRKVAVRTHCRWTEDEDGNWDTDCGEKFVFITGGPRDNGAKFCCYCGQMIREKENKDGRL